MRANTLENTLSPRPIYLIEDNEDDAEATLRAIANAGCRHKVYHFYSGEEALAALEKSVANGMGIEEVPQLIFLDLNLPGINGQEVLRQLKASEKFSVIPVVILSSLMSSSTVSEAYALGANSYVVKPVSFEALTDRMQKAQQFWFDVAIMPKVLL